MRPAPRLPSTTISAVVSDVDGTLVTDGKILTARAQAAVARLRAEDIAFAIISSRPPRGLRMLIDPLEITTPIVGFNGGLVTTPGFSPLTQHLMSSAAARQTVEIIDAHGADSNGENGFAAAIERFVLGGRRLNAPASRPAAGGRIR
jgi:hydroxymethylpyrimidine pyrophosphatase-like HAD family hydrolase